MSRSTNPSEGALPAQQRGGPRGTPATGPVRRSTLACVYSPWGQHVPFDACPNLNDSGGAILHRKRGRGKGAVGWRQETNSQLPIPNSQPARTSVWELGVGNWEFGADLTSC